MQTHLTQPGSRETEDQENPTRQSAQHGSKVRVGCMAAWVILAPFLAAPGSRWPMGNPGGTGGHAGADPEAGRPDPEAQRYQLA